VQQLRGAFQQIAGKVAGSGNHPTVVLREADLLAEQLTSMAPMRFKTNFTSPRFALRKTSQEIVVGQAHGKIRPAARFFQAPRKLFQRLVRGRKAVTLGQLRELFPDGLWR